MSGRTTKAKGVVATDVGEGLDLLRRNLSRQENVAALGSRHSALRSAQLRWDEGAAEDLALIRSDCDSEDGFHLDTVIVFDALYNQDALGSLCEVIRRISDLFGSVRALVVGYQDRQPEVEARGLHMVQEGFLAGESGRVRRLFDLAPVHAIIIEKMSP